MSEKKNETISLNQKNVLIAVVAIVLLAGGIFYFVGGDSSEIQRDEIVAKVNGEEIMQSQVEQVQQSFAAQGQQIDEEEAVRQAVDSELLVQEAENSGYSISTEEAEQTLESIASQQGQTLESIKQDVESQGMSYEELINEYKKQIALQEYINDITQNQIQEKSTEELKEFYNQNKELLAQEGEVPEFEEVEAQLEMFLQQQEQQQIISSIISELRTNANIEYL